MEYFGTCIVLGMFDIVLVASSLQLSAIRHKLTHSHLSHGHTQQRKSKNKLVPENSIGGSDQ